MKTFEENKKEYLASIQEWGYRIAYDASTEKSLFDLELLCTSTTKEGVVQYSMYQIAPTNELSVEKYGEYKANGKLNEFKQGFLNWIRVMTFGTNDLIACLLLEGYDIEKIWVNNKIHLTPSIIRVLINSLCSKGSPLR